MTYSPAGRRSTTKAAESRPTTPYQTTRVALPLRTNMDMAWILPHSRSRSQTTIPKPKMQPRRGLASKYSEQSYIIAASMTHSTETKSHLISFRDLSPACRTVTRRGLPSWLTISKAAKTMHKGTTESIGSPVDEEGPQP